MIVARGPGELRLDGPIVISVGVFDGVHRGHRAVFDRLAEEARASRARSVVVSLAPHPLEVLRPEAAPPLLTTPEERVRLLEAVGPDAVVLYPFDRATANLSPSAFLDRLVPREARLKALVAGYDFRMGKDRSGGFAELGEVGARRGFRVVRVGPTVVEGEPVSSSRIRRRIAEGRVREAAELLGHPYPIEGVVVRGRGVGRTLDFPTANVDVGDRRKLLPGFGVYAVLVRILDESGDPLPGVMNRGIRPTFGSGHPVMEVHLPGFRGDLIGRRLLLEPIERIREERAFAGPEDLAARIGEDVEEARKILEGRGF